MLWQYKLDKNFDLNFEENRSLLSSMTTKICFKMLSVDEIITGRRPFPVNWVFNRILTNFEVGFILQPFFLDYNWIARLKVLLKVVLNHVGACGRLCHCTLATPASGVAGTCAPQVEMHGHHQQLELLTPSMASAGPDQASPWLSHSGCYWCSAQVTIN